MDGGGLEQQSAILDGRYRLERELGAGAFGRVFVAFDTRLQRTVAIKELLAAQTAADPRLFERYLDRFEREARAAGSVFHPNVVNVFELAIDPRNDYYLIMEYIDGGNLRDLLTRVGTLPAERALQITLDIAHALEAIHEVDIVHRDLKPSNIMLTRRGVAKLADFGVAQIGTESHRTQFATGHPGTPLYMSPEQRQNSDYLDGRADLYSLGLVLYEMLVGEPYARRKQPLEQARPDIPVALVQFFQRLTEREPAYRYQSAEELVSDLQAQIGTQSHDRRTIATSPTESNAAYGGMQAPAPLDAALQAGTGTGERSGAPLVAPAPRRAGAPWPAILGGVGAMVLILAVIAAWLVTHGGMQPTAPLTATPGVGGGPTVAAAAIVTEPASATVGTGAAIIPATVPSPTATPATPMVTPTVPPTATVAVRPNWQAVSDARNAIAFAYPQAWQRSDDTTDQDTLYSFRMSPSAQFLVAKEENPKFTTLDAYTEDEITGVTAQHPGWKPGTRARQAAKLGGQDARIADFIVPNNGGQDYHYYVLTLRPGRAWGVFFVMPLNDFATFQKDIDDVVRSFTFCTGSACAPQAGRPAPAQGAPGSAYPLGVLLGTPMRRPPLLRSPDDQSV